MRPGLFSKTGGCPVASQNQEGNSGPSGAVRGLNDRNPACDVLAPFRLKPARPWQVMHDAVGTKPFGHRIAEANVEAGTVY